MRMPVLCCLFVLSALILVAPPIRADQTGSPDGSALYARYCASCHQALDKTVLAGRSLSRIRSAIRHFAVMSRLKTIEEGELVAIAAVLAVPDATGQ